jgi:serine/threonine-protein kinase RsbW
MPPDLDQHPRLADVTGGRPQVSLSLCSSSLSVRSALLQVRAALADLTLDADASGSIEIVLAEVLNNIGEHAYRGQDEGRIELRIWARGEALLFETRDFGLPMPNGRMPAGRAASLDCPAEDSPEGGFGWHLLRTLTADLFSARVGERNHLTFRMRRDARPIDR